MLPLVKKEQIALQETDLVGDDWAKLTDKQKARVNKMVCDNSQFKYVEDNFELTNNV